MTLTPLLDLVSRISGPTPEVPEPLLEVCMDLLRLGLRFETLKDFAGLDPFDFRALAAAARRLEVEKAARAGLANLGPAGVAAVLEEIDGGAATAELVAQAGLDALARRDP